MEFLTLLIIAIGLAMDSVTVSISCALILYKFNFKNTFRIALFMGVFQGTMPIIGWWLGHSFRVYIEAYDHWIAFIILMFLGARMIYQHITTNDDFKCFDPTSYKTLTGLAIATSIDALAVGITFGLIEISLITAALVIGLVSFILSFLAIYLASKFKQKLKFPFELVGGIILILIGVKILIEHILNHG
ncbi:MAG: manganese efflux pump MntP family protein [Salinivirgaceae bacterium]|jgi:putative Mn2+ efflux pump MntP|nr:manganese efflux pump MntP family protein [Salinivirgaceae bacterium]